jgi:hypothetical protein
MGFCRWLFSDTNRLGIDGIVMLGGICQDGRTQATINVENLQSRLADDTAVAY